jgi:hypothetical protein
MLMQYVDVEVLTTGLIVCKSRDCRYKRECANHTTAGDFRTEDGFTPRMCEGENDKWLCTTIDAPAEKMDTNAMVGEVTWREHPEGAYDVGALNADGTVCGFWTDARGGARTFEVAIGDARMALDEAWRIMPTEERGQIRDNLRLCFDALDDITRRMEKDA